ncbi:MAG TPA: UpxY family transcription antiterminator [Myxococcota bacterium]|nr:UpxY family transcription antiterminator [Myxococcota bacterium]
MSRPEEPAWYAVHTRSRHERKVLAELARQSFEAFLPEYRTWSRRKDRRKQILKPLFPGYLFVRSGMSPALRLAILQTASVVRLVGIGYEPVPVPDREVESIKILLQGAGDARPAEPLKIGQRVQVMEGPLSGVIGVVEQSARRRIVVSVDLLGRAVAASLETEAVVPYLDG